jgi:CTP synthase
VKELRELGLQPDVIVARCREPLLDSTKEKISLFCDVKKEAVIGAVDVDDIYRLPSVFAEEGLFDVIKEKLKLDDRDAMESSWENVVIQLDSISRRKHVKMPRIAIVGKYTHLVDSYLSIREAIKHAAMELGCKPKIEWIEAEEFEEDEEGVERLWDYHGILVPGGFGTRGVEGKMMAIRYAREHDIPYLGLCLGMQLSIVEFARNVVGLEGAGSTEWSETPHPVIDLLPEQKKLKDYGGTMRLGGYEIDIVEGTLAHQIYGRKKIRERHRHRYEVNPKYVPLLQKHGLVISGTHKERVEIIEFPKNRFYLATQFHPEFNSRPGKASPPFVGFLRSMLR